MTMCINLSQGVKVFIRLAPYLNRVIFSFQALNNSNNEHVYYIRAERDEFVLGLQLLNPFHNYTTEELLIYDYRKIKIDPLIQVRDPVWFWVL
jgi:hypothetical protein